MLHNVSKGIVLITVFTSKQFRVSFKFIYCYTWMTLIACKAQDETMKLKKNLNIEFEIKDLGPANKILGMEIKRNRKLGILLLSQSGCIKKVVKLFDRSQAKPILVLEKCMKMYFYFAKLTNKLRFN